MNIPYYRFIEGECYLLHSKNNISKLSGKMLSDNISDDEFTQFIEQCILKTKFKKE